MLTVLWKLFGYFEIYGAKYEIEGSTKEQGVEVSPV